MLNDRKSNNIIYKGKTWVIKKNIRIIKLCPKTQSDISRNTIINHFDSNSISKIRHSTICKKCTFYFIDRHVYS